MKGKITNSLLCGIVNYDRESPHPLLDTLPDILHFPKLEPTEPIWTTVKLIDAETQRVHHRSGPIVDRLTEVLFLQLLHYHVERGDDAVGFFAALRDRRIQRALSLIHREPAFNWTLTSLGARVGMSRATLVRHFQDAIGVAPMTYVANWRLMKAYNQIKYTAAPLERIAESTGFASARTMNRSFQRHYGYTPNKLRQFAKDEL